MSVPMWFQIHDGITTAEVCNVNLVIYMQFLLTGDMLVLDNAPNQKLKKTIFLWTGYGRDLISLFYDYQPGLLNWIHLKWLGVLCNADDSTSSIQNHQSGPCFICRKFHLRLYSSWGYWKCLLYMIPRLYKITNNYFHW